MRNLLILQLIILFAVGCQTSKDSEVHEENISLITVNPERVLNVGFVIVDGVYNTEVIAPFDIFQHTVFHNEFGMKVFTVAPTLNPITTFEGLRLIPDYSFDSDSLPEIDVLVVASAEHSMDTDLENEELINFVKTRGSSAMYVMSLCDGAFVLAKAGLCDDHETTTFPGDIGRYKETYPQLTVHEGLSFVHDDNLITSAGGAKSFDSALYLAELLYGKKAADGLAGGLVIDWNLSKVNHVIVE